MTLITWVSIIRSCAFSKGCDRLCEERANVAVVCLEEHKDARETKRLVKEQGRKCWLIDGDVGDEKFCKEALEQTAKGFGKIDILCSRANITTTAVGE
jgi:NAD(P)-dependent dehydrogenase (short-subunit alcohol dehydrogenase family)